MFSALDPAGLDEQATRLLDKVLEDFRRSGVDRDEETRARIAAINERITELDQEFAKVVRDDVRSIRVTPERLDGLPADWLEAHPADDDGLVTVTTDYPDVVPTRMFAHDAEVRREITMAFLNRGWPASDALLKEMFALRHELAGLVGYDDWASYDADVKMIKTGPAIPEFIDKIAAAAEGPMQRDLAILMERFRRDHPDAGAITGGRRHLLRGAGPQGAAPGRRPGGAHLLRLREGAPGAARRHRAAVRRGPVGDAQGGEPLVDPEARVSSRAARADVERAEQQRASPSGAASRPTPTARDRFSHAGREA